MVAKKIQVIKEKEQKEDCVTQTVANTYALKYYTHINLQVFGNG
tara:strand:+ start:27 stop:158 length:132 start_codon:yes stop_codon:yes gene_type:complete